MRKLVAFVLLLFCFDAVSGQQVRSIELKGNKRLKTSFLKRILTQKVDMALDSTSVLKDVQQLQQLPSVSRATFKVQMQENKEECLLIYEITENFTLIPYVNFYATNNDEFAYRLGAQEFNFLGRNITLGGFFREMYFIRML